MEKETKPSKTASTVPPLSSHGGISSRRGHDGHNLGTAHARRSIGLGPHTGVKKSRESRRNSLPTVIEASDLEKLKSLSPSPERPQSAVMNRKQPEIPISRLVAQASSAKQMMAAGALNLTPGMAASDRPQTAGGSGVRQVVGDDSSLKGGGMGTVAGAVGNRTRPQTAGVARIGLGITAPLTPRLGGAQDRRLAPLKPLR